MLTDLLQRKFTRYFNVLDYDHNGVIEQEDFENIALTLAQMRNWAAGSPEHQACRAGLMSIWQHLQQFADTSQDGRISLEEWLKNEEDAIATAENYAKYVTPVAAGLFDAVDENGDGVISVQEYRNFFKGFRIDPDLADDVFARLDVDGDGQLSKEELLQHVYDLHCSNDPAAPGNWILGPF
jgi:juvenile hormone diol kinase